jgi:hypothetical protein
MPGKRGFGAICVLLENSTPAAPRQSVNDNNAISILNFLRLNPFSEREIVGYDNPH